MNNKELIDKILGVNFFRDLTEPLLKSGTSAIKDLGEGLEYAVPIDLMPIKGMKIEEKDGMTIISYPTLQEIKPKEECEAKCRKELAKVFHQEWLKAVDKIRKVLDELGMGIADRMREVVDDTTNKRTA